MVLPAFPGAVNLEAFAPRWPWLNGDLQTLRDSLRPQRLPADHGQPHRFLLDDGDQLLGLLDPPLPAVSQGRPLAVVVVVHGLAGGSDRIGPRRLALTLQRAGFAVLRLNLRGAGPGRQLARGSYAAQSNRDLVPVLRQMRQLAAGLPLLGVGLSLGGTNLLNAVVHAEPEALLDGLVCMSSPLDLQACSRQIARPRNRLYERWLLRRLVAEAAADPHGLAPAERIALGQGQLRSIRGFDAAITAPRWGYPSVEAYYADASPLPRLLERPQQRPPTLIVHALDDPWVPVAAAQQLHQGLATARQQGDQPPAALEVLLTSAGGHNGFHARSDSSAAVGGCWSDRLAARWLQRLIADQLLSSPSA